MNLTAMFNQRLSEFFGSGILVARYAFNESDHPRDDDGQFTSGSGVAGGKSPDAPSGSSTAPAAGDSQNPMQSARASNLQGVGFASPNVEEDTKYSDAVSQLTSDRFRTLRKRFEEIDNRLGLKSRSLAAIGDWNTGAEASVVTQYTDFQDFDELRYAMAAKGLEAQQMATLLFQEDPNSSDALHHFEVKDSIENIRKVLDESGIDSRTFLVDNDDVKKIYVVDYGGSLAPQLRKFSGHYNVTGSTYNGRAELIGSFDSREAGKHEFERIISDYRQRFPDRESYWRIAATGMGLSVGGSVRDSGGHRARSSEVPTEARYTAGGVDVRDKSRLTSCFDRELYARGFSLRSSFSDRASFADRYAFRESDHPRDESGRFTDADGGGGSSISTSSGSKSAATQKRDPVSKSVAGYFGITTPKGVKVSPSGQIKLTAPKSASAATEMLDSIGKMHDIAVSEFEQTKTDPSSDEARVAASLRLAHVQSQLSRAIAMSRAVEASPVKSPAKPDLSANISGQTVNFVPHPYARRNETTVMVDASKLDKLWQESDPSPAGKKPTYYIPTGGGGAEIEGRRAGVEEFLKKGEPIQASRIYLNQAGKVHFADGRHRFSILRDRGAHQVAVTVEKSALPKVRELLGGEQTLMEQFDALISRAIADIDSNSSIK